MAENMSGAFSADLMGDLLNQAAEEAVELGQRINYGRLTYGEPRYIEWNDSVPTEVSRERYMQVKSDNPRGASMELRILVDIQELQPNLEFTYERRVGVNSADWFAHWQKSVVEYFDLDSQVDTLSESELQQYLGPEADVSGELTSKQRRLVIGKLAMEKMVEIPGKYVALEDVPQEKESSDGKVYRTPELVNVFESKEECRAAREERFGSSATSPATTADIGHEVPEGFDTYGDFEDVVKMLREGGDNDMKIAENLDVSVKQVASVR